jgi:hypothetical protein
MTHSRPPAKHKYSVIKLKDAMQLLGRETLTLWQPPSPPRPPSAILLENLRRLNSFDLRSTEQGKTLLIDALFAEIVPDHPNLKVWKAAALDTDTLTGVADYLIAPFRAYLETPLLCVTEAKRDDFERGQTQCLAEMYACAWNNQQAGQNVEVYGIVSNGQVWLFYQWGRGGDIYETEQYAISDLPRLLGVLDYVCGECARLVP